MKGANKVCCWGFLLKFLDTFQFCLKADKITDIFHEDLHVLLRMSRLCIAKY
jgi:hypothetical protein